MRHSLVHTIHDSHLGSVDEFIRKAFGNRLDVAEGRSTGTTGKEPDGVVHTTERRHIDGLSTDGTSRTNAGRVFTGTTVDDGIHQDLS